MTSSDQSRETLLYRRRELVAEELDGETLVADPEAARFQSLNRSAAFLWRLLERPATIDALAAALTDRYSIDGERARVDARAFVRELERRGLLEIAHG